MNEDPTDVALTEADYEELMDPWALHSGSSEHQNAARVGRINRAEMRVTSMVAVMIVAFMIAWTPYAIFALIEQFGPTELIGPGLAVLPALIAKSSICYNPIIYVGMNTQFRAAFSRVRNKSTLETEQNTTTLQRELTKSSRDLIECSFDFCRRKNRFKISLVKPSPSLGGTANLSNATQQEKDSEPIDQTVLNMTTDESSRCGTDGQSAPQDKGARFNLGVYMSTRGGPYGAVFKVNTGIESSTVGVFVGRVKLPNECVAPKTDRSDSRLLSASGPGAYERPTAPGSILPHRYSDAYFKLITEPPFGAQLVFTALVPIARQRKNYHIYSALLENIVIAPV
ncbi:hypothetical protein AND_001414 [Anopheles darlingi]|uniref:G-protein coupled receptors family 1 profile domain-containing protein n=1 Tax=Anopheles darlingi TaxID=43151 RepID=W5JU21_ANODA|nr:hypothetical protein AND_001414 [Anopheles darlingi]